MAHHTDCIVLSAANRAAFQGHIHGLLVEGRQADAEALWAAVFEVVHIPWPDLMLDFPQLPPMRTIVCTDSNCNRCQQGRGGFGFPFLGPWCRRRVVVPPGVEPAAAWDDYNNHPELMDPLLVAMYASRWQVADFCPVLWDSTLARASRQLGGTALAELRSCWRTWQLDSPRWISPAAGPIPPRQAGREHSRHRAHRAMWAWMAATGQNILPHLPGSCISCGGPASWFCRGCGRGLCRECELEDPLTCCELTIFGMRTREFIPCVDMEELLADVDDDIWNVG